MLDDPLIRYAQKNGFAPWNVPKEPRCPICGQDAESFYKDIDGEIVGCDNCIKEVDAWECADETH